MPLRSYTVAAVESGTDLTLMITVIGTGAVVLGGLFGFAVFFLRRLDTISREIRDEVQGVRTEVQGVRTDLGHRIDGVNIRVDQVILAMIGSAPEPPTAADP